VWREANPAEIFVVVRSTAFFFLVHALRVRLSLSSMALRPLLYGGLDQPNESSRTVLVLGESRFLGANISAEAVLIAAGSCMAGTVELVAVSSRVCDEFLVT